MSRGLAAFVRKPDLSLAGELRGWTRLEVTLRWLGVGSWQVQGPNRGLLASLMEPRRGLVVVDRRGIPLHSPNNVVISGDLEEDGPLTWTAEGSDSGPGTITLAGGDDLAIVADELAYPDPTRTVVDQITSTDAYDVRSGAAETVIKGYVGANVGADRHANRDDPDVPDARTVVIAADQERGATVSYRARFDPLLEVVSKVSAASAAAAGPHLGARVQQDGTDLVFDVYEPADRSARVRFSRARRNLRGYSLTRSMPTATHAVVAGGGEGTARVFRERKDASAANEWGRVVRVFVDQRQTTETTELDAAGDEALEQGRRTGALSVTAVDTPSCRFGVHFGLGDLVAVELGTGTALVDRVTSAVISATEEGPQPTQITIGVPDLDPQTSELYALVKRLQEQLGALQRRL